MSSLPNNPVSSVCWRRRILSPASISAVFAVFLWVAAITAGINSGLELPVVHKDVNHHPWERVIPIFANNALAALSLYAGVVLLGTVSVLQTIVLGLFSGGAIHAAVAGLGTSQAIELLVPYFVFEALGLVVATWAGLLPVTTLVIGYPFRDEPSPRGWRSRISLYLNAVPRTVPLLALAMFFIMVGAVLEVAGGLPR